ncbi:fluconazole resistance protein 1 [Nannizzia gypsea CBS 118893]|uniref:Fluconazole resistance protein 1 n=1 Tax=Arthroderma gypseum (strain ATCC MYA-4604 / CBS 118893) TaxID=535722 RepID=E4UTG3_ARTGP|nr:fluconazole resistance protein 1 [Nannizzia gypsea CBS 118893]EFR01508.1 fluconazole resistance protein 1 [Nannizzia gypsea CBS 118893]
MGAAETAMDTRPVELCSSTKDAVAPEAPLELDNTNIEAVPVSQKAELLLVDWDGPDDPQNPLNWTKTKKWLNIILVAYITFVTSYGSTILAPGVPALLQEFGVTNNSLASFVVSIYILGFCVGPLFLAPLSELYGRLPIIQLSNVFFLVFSIACAVSTNIGMFIFFRLMQGISACPPLTLGGGLISDLMVPTERGRALSIWAMGPLLGPVIGPVIGGYMNETIGWRWTFWFTAIMTGVSILASVAILRETYAPTLLARKCACLRKQTGNPEYKSKFDKGLSAGYLFKQAIIRPTKMLILSPIVLVLAIHMSIIYSYLYFMFTTFTFVFKDHYNFNSGEAGLAYLGLGTGFVVGQFSVGYSSDLYVRKKSNMTGVMKPEYRLPPLVISAFLIPIGLIWYGWTAEKQVHWIVPIIGTAFIGIGTMCAFLPIQIYLIDTFGIYAASALATNTVVRSLFGAVLPLAGPPLFKRLGLGWGNSLLAFIALSLSPAAFFLLKYGEYIRTHPKFQVKL